MWSGLNHDFYQPTLALYLIYDMICMMDELIGKANTCQDVILLCTALHSTAADGTCWCSLVDKLYNGHAVSN